jgi:hypothetical protein
MARAALIAWSQDGRNTVAVHGSVPPALRLPTRLWDLLSGIRVVTKKLTTDPLRTSLLVFMTYTERGSDLHVISLRKAKRHEIKAFARWVSGQS